MKDSLQKEQNEKGNEEKGASLVEYALLVALIAVVAIVAIQTLGKGVSERSSHLLLVQLWDNKLRLGCAACPIW